MSSILMCISPAESHSGPILGVARAFVDAGHRVRVLTGARLLADPRYRDAAARIGRDIERSPGADGIVTEVERLIGERAATTVGG